MKKTYWCTLLAAVLLTLAPLCRADEAANKQLKPFFVLSFSGYNAIMADADYIGGLGGNADMSKAVEGMLHMMTQGKGLAGLDKKRPWGMIILPDPDNLENSVRPYVFLPVTELDKFLEVLKGFGIDSDDADDGAKKLLSNDLPPNTFVKQVGKWVLVTNKASNFADAPKDPEALVGKTAKKYDIMASLLVSNVPQEMKNVFLSQIDMVSQIMAMQDGKEDQVAQLKKAFDQVKQYANDLESMTLGLAINDPDSKTYLDVLTTAKPDTKTAKELAGTQKGPSEFAGFYNPKAAFTLNFIGKLTPANTIQARLMLLDRQKRFVKSLEAQEMDQEKKDKIKTLSEDLVGLFLDTLEGDKVDGGAAVWLGKDQAAAVAGGRVADGKKLDEIVRKSFTMLLEDSSDIENLLKLDADKQGDISFHTITLPVEMLGDDAPWEQLVGNPLVIVLGTGPKAAYLAIGRDAMAKLKSAINVSASVAETEVLPTRAALSVTSLVDFFSVTAKSDQEKQQAAMIAAILSQAGDKDHVFYTVEPIPNGVRQRIEIESGLLKTLGAMSQLIGSQMVPTPPVDSVD